MEWAAKDTHLRGIPRRIVMSAGGAFTKLVTSFLNNTQVHNKDTLLHLIKSRPSGTPLITVSNHMSTLDDPLMWGFKGSPVMDWKRARWTLTAEDICFTNPLLSYFFRLGKCIPITRGAGIYQTNMNEALDRINEGEWLHTFPEGKISQERGPIRRLKWGTASLIVRASVTPIVLPIAHSGFEKVMPEKHWFGRRPFIPLCLKNISIVVGQPMEFDIPTLLQRAESISRNLRLSGKAEGIEADRNHSNSSGWPSGLCKGLDESAQKWLFAHLSEQIQNVMQKLYMKARSLNQTS
ncbi:hypothetical protein SUGI_0435840 [Cryptomeria japonica]|uniref:N-acylphosphatidylethanolamine synthase isoform X2 n=1 Tax=Cryptomeria japonica TaxID=3369 RepID=UPI002408D1E2|nr:N-acylphosphatidylethanolamine synthase isoform X2 [Cryptomeria japonica]GLJ23086.1 hypothetical protein SUGI_0435840 [Cryptomeria japonica]